MAEGGFDPCECICNHEYAMRRLINLVSRGTEGLLPSPEILSGRLDFNRAEVHGHSILRVFRVCSMKHKYLLLKLSEGR